MASGEQIGQLIAEGTYYGMQTFDQHLVALIRDGVISLEAAMQASTIARQISAKSATLAWPPRTMF